MRKINGPFFVPTFEEKKAKKAFGAFSKYTLIPILFQIDVFLDIY